MNVRFLLFSALLGLAGCPTSPADDDDAASTPELVSNALASGHPASAWFDRSVSVFGATVYAAPDVPEDKLLHAANLFAQYVDNDEDGEADDPALPPSYAERNASLVMFATFEDLENSNIFESPWLDTIHGQDLVAEETLPDGGFDAALEEVLHLVNTAGHSEVYPQAFGPRDSLLTNAMDLARGGDFESVPVSYPPEAWYHYDDVTCEYECMAIEYLYWALTSLLGAQAERCDEIDQEWEPCTAALLESMDPTMHALITDPQYRLPTVLPDGSYRN
jgi:hypothetical protein